ncbi:MAG: hypothetical protein FWG98_07365 [Candidatus Cloacimonetes bacterium]|nr:hypothetical protein [Candidatus Cloacimonadota bacterium]
MNRIEGSARYSIMIRENETIIDELIKEAQQNQRTFEAVQMLNLAHSFAVVTDNFQSILSVLNPAFIGRTPSYRNAESIRTLSQNSLREIVITVNVSGDENDRIQRAFTESLNSRGFRTSDSAVGQYTLYVSFVLENIESASSRFQYVRYVLNYSLRNSIGVELFSSSENGREGHLNVSEARNRAIQIVERSIGTTGFAESFEAFLEGM